MGEWDGPDRRQAPRWSDDRIDDLARIVSKNDERLDALQNLVAAHDLQLIEIVRARKANSEHSFTMRVTVIGAVLMAALSEIATLITVLLKH